MLQWCRANGCSWRTVHCARAATRGDGYGRDMLDWCTQNDCPLHEDTCALAADKCIPIMTCSVGPAQMEPPGTRIPMLRLYDAETSMCYNNGAGGKVALGRIGRACGLLKALPPYAPVGAVSRLPMGHNGVLLCCRAGSSHA